MEVKKWDGKQELKGYFSDMPESFYHNTDGFISKSSLSALKASPFKYFSGIKMEPTKAMQVGTAIHCAVLEPEKFDREYVILNDCKDRRQKEYKNAVKEHGVERVLLKSDHENITNMKAAIYGNDAARELLELDGWCEVSGFSYDEETGVGLRHRFDKLTKCGIGVDLKKTQSVHPDEISKTVSKYGYHMQQALYSDGYRDISGEQLKAFYFIFVEEKYPHQVAVVYLDDISVNVGRDEYRECLSEYLYYVEFPSAASNNSEIQMISLPEWKLRDYETELEDGGIF